MNTGSIPRRVARPHNAPVSSVTTLLAGGGFSRPKVQSWAKVQLSNDLKQGQLTAVQNRATLTVTSGISALQPCYLMCRQGQKRTLERGGKRGAKDRGQTGSCGELKSQTKAYLEITEPRGWKRIPPSVIVSHVLLPSCNIFQIKACSSLLYSKDTLQFHRGKKTEEPQKGNCFFHCTWDNVLPLMLLLGSADKLLYDFHFSQDFYKENQRLIETSSKGFYIKST